MAHKKVMGKYPEPFPKILGKALNEHGPYMLTFNCVNIWGGTFYFDIVLLKWC